jgi:hypothetical protein
MAPNASLSCMFGVVRALSLAAPVFCRVCFILVFVVSFNALFHIEKYWLQV